MRLSQFQKLDETREVTLHFESGPLWVKVYPNRRSIGWSRELKKAIDNNDAGKVADLFFRTLAEWDMTDDDGNVVPFTEEVIDGIGLEQFGEFNTKLAEALNPNPTTSTS